MHGATKWMYCERKVASRDLVYTGTAPAAAHETHQPDHNVLINQQCHFYIISIVCNVLLFDKLPSYALLRGGNAVYVCTAANGNIKYTLNYDPN